MQNLDQVSKLEGPVLGVHEQPVLSADPGTHRQILSECSYCRRDNERDSILLALPTADEQAAFLGIPVLDEEANHLTGAQAGVGHCEDHCTIAGAHQRGRAALQHRAQLLVRGNLRQRGRHPDAEPGEWVAAECASRLQPPYECLETPVGLVDRGGAEAVPPEPGEEPRDGRAVERPDIVAHFGPEPVKPPAIDADRALTAPAHLFVEQERLSQVPDGPARLGVSLCFIRYFRGVSIVR